MKDASKAATTLTKWKALLKNSQQLKTALSR